MNIDKNKIDNFTEISEFVFKTLDNSETFPRDDSDFIKKDGYSTDYDNFKHCELYKLLASTDVIDIVELFLYKELLSGLAAEFIGENAVETQAATDAEKEKLEQAAKEAADKAVEDLSEEKKTIAEDTAE